MILTPLKDGSMKVHMGDEDDYELTDDNGVDIWFSKEQLNAIVTAAGMGAEEDA